jgi:pyruvate/2-oxoglutarate dehydrogenase complex dihydrolipoamide dehydrogenase (E3) component
MERFDLIAIGGGTAGLVTASGGASLGLRVALVERDALGGDCLWTGCVPSKALIASARLAHAMRHASSLGLHDASPSHVFETVMQRMRTARARVAEHDDPERFRKMGVDVIFGEARFVASDQIRVDGRTLQSPRIVIATGAIPSVPPIGGLADAGYLTHMNAFDQKTLPARIAVVGGGPIGLEFAQVYRRLGAEVVVIEMLSQLLPAEEPKAAAILRDVLTREGIEIRTDAQLDLVETPDTGRKVLHLRNGLGRRETLLVDEIFVATGRRPDTGTLELEAGGIETTGGAVAVDDTLRSSVRGVWAAGDVAGGPQFTHVADYQAKLVLRNAIFPLSSRADYSTVPAVTYTDPEVARVGLTEAEARERYGDVRVYGYEFADLDRAIVDGHTTGFVRVVTRGKGRIVGATIVATGAGELLMAIVVAMKQKMPLAKLSRVIYPYPTMVEAVKRTADAFYREKLDGRTGRLVRRVVRWLT